MTGNAQTPESAHRPRLIRAFQPFGRFYSALVFEPRDLWVGLYWTREGAQTIFYVCLIPTLVLKVVRDA